MKVRLKGDISGSRDGVAWPQRGGVIDLPEDEALSLLNSGMAEPADRAATPPVETATAPVAAVEKRPAPEVRRPTQPVRGARK